MNHWPNIFIVSVLYGMVTAGAADAQVQPVIILTSSHNEIYARAEEGVRA